VELQARIAREFETLSGLAVLEGGVDPSAVGAFEAAEVPAVLLTDEAPGDDRRATQSGMRPACS
jgi:hypothetical protein